MVPIQQQAEPAARSSLVRCMDACDECAQACTACADKCLAEQSVEELVGCTQLALDCADICQAAGRILARQAEYDTGVIRSSVEACVAVCIACAEECEEHGTEPCRACAEVCRRCAAACRELLGVI